MSFSSRTLDLKVHYLPQLELEHGIGPIAAEAKPLIAIVSESIPQSIADCTVLTKLSTWAIVDYL